MIKALLIFAATVTISINSQSLTYPVVDTDQTKFYNNTSEIPRPSAEESFYGQDAHHDGNLPSYTDNGDGTITDNITGLMWQQGLPEIKYTFEESFEYAENSNLAGHTDWRIPTIKELYSLILFSGSTGNQGIGGVPYIDTDYFEFRYGDEYNPSERPIDAQYVSSNAYVETVMDGQSGVFGLNLADGRIKCYPQNKEFEVKLVRGSTDYGINNFQGNGNGTLTDLSTGLMWDQNGSSDGMSWEEALDYIQELNSQNHLGYSDWRLPNAKELHSIVDYSRSPGTTNSAAIDPVFSVPLIFDEEGNEDYPFYWTSTTHDDGPYPDHAVYISFGRALGFMQFFGDSDLQLYDVHGAGAQRSDPKSGDPSDYPYGFGPQGDVIRIYNYVRPVRDAEVTTDVDQAEDKPTSFNLEQNYPNPFNPSTTINFSVETLSNVSLRIFDILGKETAVLINEQKVPGTYSVTFDATNLSGGVYFYQLESGNKIQTKNMLLIK
jgi:hypothetical protein